MAKLIADENIPSEVVRKLRSAGYDVLTVTDVVSAGTKNHELAELSLRIGRILLTRDADFTRLSRSIMNRLRVVYIAAHAGPSELAGLTLTHIERCVELLQTVNIVLLDEDGCHTL